MSKFAPVTSGLLARKGDALPSGFLSLPSLPAFVAPPPPVNGSIKAPHNDVAPLAASGPSTVVDQAKRHHEPDRPHKVRVALSDAEFEKLGLAAVKRGVTRHQLIRDALNSYAEKLIEAYRGNCQCIGGDGACRSEQPCGSL